jgi:hypothetical protein
MAAADGQGRGHGSVFGNAFPSYGSDFMDRDFGMDNSGSEHDLRNFYASFDSDTDHFKEESESDGDVEDVHFAYRPSTWLQVHSSYDPIPTPFSGEAPGLIRKYMLIPSYVQLFEKFWTFNMLRDICV